ncbi:Stromal interaction molecule 2 [Bagarius yarrelli]|uniref:Stromal interaction molecule 2 n=1 Tax=Bagarius yarrelli TaxID=175774 RepID=A0A556U928_BAGYA|nr:Stromal interaction molecule 2 [Bagarius yarrelli]
MMMLDFPVTVLLICCGFSFSFSLNASEPAQKETQTITDVCQQVIPPCVTEADRYSLEALRHIHQEMDDDQDGGIEVEESVEFIIEDMQQQQQTNKHSKLHREDQHITVEELWRGWKSSEVHNWTQDDILRWLREFVELPQYEKNFKELRVSGNTLPRIASNEPSFMSTFLKIQDQQHKHKLKLKALDVVLFGPPTRPPHNWMKDLLLIVSVVMGLGGSWFAQVQNKASKEHISKMMKDLESLQRAEKSLRDLQEQLEQAQEEKRTVAVEKQFLEEKMRDEIQGAQEEANRLQELRKGAVSELSRLRYAEEELEQIRGALKKAEYDMQANWSVPESLQLWLQLTHEVEMQYYNVKKQSAEQQLAIAKDEAERIKKKRSSVLGTFQVAHSSSLDEVDHKILQAKNALAEVTACLQERLHRWQKIELLCGFAIINNAGLPKLTATLYPDTNWLVLSRATLSSYQVPVGIDDMEEGMPSVKPQKIPAVSVSPLKLSPRALVRSRRTGRIIQPPVILPHDPDLLIQIQPPTPRYDEEEEKEEVIFPAMTKQECLDTTSDPEPIGPTVGIKYTRPGCETSPRKLYRGNFFSDSVPSRIQLDGQENSPLHKILQDELGYPLRDDSRKEYQAETQAKKISREEPEVSNEALMSLVCTKESEIPYDFKKIPRSLPVDLNYSSIRLIRENVDSPIESYLGTRYTADAEITVDSLRRKMFKERKDPPGESLVKLIPKDELGTCSQSGDAGQDSRRMLREETQKGLKLLMDRHLDSGSVNPFRDDSEDSGMTLDGQRVKLIDNITFPKEQFYKKVPRDEYGLPLNKGKLFRHVSIDNTLRKKADDLNASMENQRTMSLKERRDNAVSIKRSGDERDFGMERQRLFRDIRLDNTLDIHIDKIQEDVVDMPVETVRPKLSRDEVMVPDPGHFSQPDLTVDSLVLWTPRSEPLSHLVYDGILEKSYQDPLNVTSTGELGHSVSLPSMSTSSQSLVSSDGSGTSSTQPGNLSPAESRSEIKGRKSLKLKNLFKKKKDKEKDKDSKQEHPQGGLQKL